MNFSHFGPENERHRYYFEQGAGTPEWVIDRTRRENLSPGGMGEQLWQYVDRGELPADMAPLVVRALLSAGLDTTVIGIGNALKLFAEHPDQVAHPAGEPADGFAGHQRGTALRVPVPVLLPDHVRRHRDRRRPAGSRQQAGACFWARPTGTSSRFGPDADVFRIERDAASMIAFGNGIHRCVGQPITRLEMHVVLTWLAHHVERIELTGEPVPYLHNTLKGYSLASPAAAAGLTLGWIVPTAAG